MALAALVLVQQLRVERLQVQLAQANENHEKTMRAQTQQALAAIEKKASALLGHAGQQQENTHDYTQKIAALEAARTADADRISCLRRSCRSTPAPQRPYCRGRGSG